MTRAIERRRVPRSDRDTRATGLIQAIIRDPLEATRILLGRLQEGTPPGTISIQLDDAVRYALRRGVEIRGEIELIRGRLFSAGFAV